MRNYLLFLAAYLCLIGCQSYEAKPIVVDEVLREVEKSRGVLSDDSHQSLPQDTIWQFTFANCLQLLAKNSPRLREAHAEYKRAYKLAELKTPLPNPELEVGTLIGANLGGDDSGQVQPLVAFGFTVPLGGRLQRQDELNGVVAEYAYLRYVLQHRGEYLRLRQLYVQLLLLQEQQKIQRDIVQSAEASLTVTKKLIEAGVATALDIGIMDLELLQKRADLATISGNLVEARGELAQLLGVSSGMLVSVTTSLPELPDALPPFAELKKTMLANHPELAMLGAAYEIVEKELHLEIAKQTPDITIAPSFEGDPGDDKKIFGIALRFPLPVFDRNQRAIADKEGQRELVRVQYQGAMNQALAKLETSYAAYGLQHERFALQQQILARAQKNVAIALESLQRGEVEFLKYLESERSLRAALVETTQIKMQIYQSLMQIEKTIGQPVSLFPQEQEQDLPALRSRKEDR